MCIYFSKLESYKIEVKKTFNMDTPLKTSPRVIVTFIVCGIILLQVIDIDYQTKLHTVESRYVKLGYLVMSNSVYSKFRLSQQFFGSPVLDFVLFNLMYSSYLKFRCVDISGFQSHNVHIFLELTKQKTILTTLSEQF